ncbi:class D sortase [Clostridium polynesiense]|uniref:class D sortase n=1 Tax=Clostridium polynesiense TaxID=1325933 RepID=UPI00058DFF54|nr:class D sortase [Clostridium polynesiense]
MKRRSIGVIFIIIGLAIVISASYMKYQAYSEQRKMKHNFEEGLLNLKDGIETQGDKSNNEESKFGTIAMITIPKINLSVAVGEGTDSKLLKYAVGHFEGTALPGEQGNFCVAGHRSYTYGEFFSRLEELNEGDEVEVKTSTGEYLYNVTEKFIVEPNEVWVLEPTNESVLTMVTCTKGGKKRVIIKGKLK